MVKITIPSTIAQAKKALSGLDALLTAKEWERAAIVYAFVKPDTTAKFRGNQHVEVPAQLDGHQFNIEAFSRLGIKGLRNHSDVSAYRKAWQDAIDDGWTVAVQPGDTVALPTQDFPNNPRSVQGTKSSVRAALRAGTLTITDVIDGSPDLKEKITDQVAADVELGNTVEAKVEQRRAAAVVYPPTPREPVPAKIVERLLTDLEQFWTEQFAGVGSREDVVRLIAANRNSLSLQGMALSNPLPVQMAAALRALATKANEMADLIESESALEVTA